MARELFFIAALVSVLATGGVAREEETLLARITVYWPGEGAPVACSNGKRLRAGHCAVDPEKIPYGSKVYFSDGPCVAVDTGPSVVNRKAARLSGRNSRERGALVIDRFFESKEQALAWERAHPHFMTVRVVSRRAPVRSRPEPIEQRSTKTTVVAQSNPPAAGPQRAGSFPIAGQTASATAAVLSRVQQSPISVPPPYHRRRFATNAKEEPEVSPPTCTTVPRKRSRLA